MLSSYQQQPYEGHKTSFPIRTNQLPGRVPFAAKPVRSQDDIIFLCWDVLQVQYFISWHMYTCIFFMQSKNITEEGILLIRPKKKLSHIEIKSGNIID